MPLIKRTISPVHIALTEVAEGTRNELECVTNSSLANIIRQLSSLSRHAEDMFSELVNEATVIFDKANHLQERVGRLKVKVTQLDSTVEEVSLQDINLRKPFKSSLVKDQQVVDLSSRPIAIDVIYREQCEPPPPLSKLNPYREDGKDSLKFYTDPQYFIELWYTKMQMDAEQQKKRKKTHNSPHDEIDRTKSRGQSMLRQGPKVREPASKHEKHQQVKHGPELAVYSREHQKADSDQFAVQNYHSNGDYPGNAPNATKPSSLNRSGEGVNMATTNALGYNSSAGQRAAGGQGQAIMNNGVVKRSSSSDNAGTYGANNPAVTGAQYQQQPVLQHQMSASAYSYVGQYVLQQQQLQQEMMQSQYNAAADYGRQKAQSPVKRSTIETPVSRSNSAYIGMNRPNQPPPATPGQESLQPGSLLEMQMWFGSDSRESLPPPPPPPQEREDDGRVDMSGKMAIKSPPSVQKKPSFKQPQSNLLGNQRESSLSPLGVEQRHNSDGNDSSFDLLPPPPHLFHDMSSSPGNMQMPPITPPPPMDNGYDDDLLPTPPAMQLIQPVTILNHDNNKIMNGGNVGILPNSSEQPVYAQPDLNAFASSASLGNASAKEDSGGSADAVMDTRSDLLAAIRKGLQLRKVEEQRIKKEQQKIPPPNTGKRLDVQAIMEAAFEARRQMLEDSDSDFDGDENGGEWSD